MALPLDVRSDHDVPHFLKALKKKNLTIILVYATWCPHCHTIMPHFDKASQCPTNTISSVKVNETMLSKINDAISKSVNKSAPPIKVDGYPSILIVNKNAEKITDIEPVNDTEILKKVMNIDKQNNNSTLLILVAAVIFIFVVLPYFDKKTNENMSNLEHIMKL